jgi:signal transduction histidine kinase
MKWYRQPILSFLLCLIQIGLGQLVYAQNSFEKQVYFLEDTTLVLNAVRANQLQKQGSFQNLIGDSKYISSKKMYHWFYVKIQNHKEPKNLVIDIGNPHIDQIELFKKSDNQMVALGETGDIFPYKHRPVATRNFVFQLNLHANEPGEYFVCIKHLNSPLWMTLRVEERDTLFEKEKTDLLIYGLFFGIVLMMVITNLFHYFNQKDLTYLFYSLYVCFLSLFFVADFGLGYEYLWGNSPMLENYSRPTLASIDFSLQVILMRLFIHQNKTSKFYTPINYLLACLLLSIVIFVFGFFSGGLTVNSKAFYIPAMQLVYIAGVLLVFASLYEAYKRGNRASLYYLFSLFPFCIWLIFDSFSKFFGIGHLPFVLPPFAISFLAEIIILAFGLSLRFNLFKKESEVFQQKLSQSKVETAQQIIIAQENERNRIAQDLHDEVGGSLGTLKGMLSSLVSKDKKYLESLKLLDKTHQDLRNISHNLMPPEFEYFGLKNSLSNSLQNLQRAYPAIKFEFLVTGNELRLKPEIELNIYRIISELLNNVIKHSKATEATVQLNFYADEIIMMVEDNGVGIKNKNNLDDTSGIGLKTINSRANYIGANLVFDSNQFGTTVVFEFFLSPENFYEPKNPDSR